MALEDSSNLEMPREQQAQLSSSQAYEYAHLIVLPMDAIQN
jgi:hypothetical protein